MSSRTHLSSEQLIALGDLISERAALHFPLDRAVDLERRLRAAARDLELPSAKACADELLAGRLRPQQFEAVIDALTIGETYFYRDPTLLKQLEHRVLLPLLAERRRGARRLRIWSAGCSTGEEPYTLAMMLSQLIPDLDDWQITILATDINRRSLAKARQATYSSWSFRSAPPWLKSRFFARQSDGRYLLCERVRRMVRFDYLNLAEPTYPTAANGTADVDILLCRNVLMYFSAAAISQIVDRFHGAVATGGWLVVSPSEVSSTYYPPFTSVMFPNAVFYRKPELPAPVPPPQPQPQVSMAASGDLVAPSSGEEIVARAEALANSGAPHEAITVLVELMAAAQADRPARARAAALLARLTADAGNLQQAGHWCREAIALDGSNPQLHFLLATVALENDDLEAAEDALQRALRLDQDFVVAHFTLGNVTRRQRKYQQSEKSFANVLSLLRRYRHDDVLPQSDGMTAGRLSAIATAMTQR